ncbi:carbonic anhydrase [Membranihabitans marinus]|uniref:carbonic anhydrase n=1 Tax=Membranihabitans marinus TaxID=1227546 RepID=UPI001F48D24D|nr:carbonic anhydrase [Membranihabitans marinus]
MDLDLIFKNNEDWVREKLNLNPDYFVDLSKGQNPKILYIGCSDSRVTAEELMGAAPGEIFVHRNIANLVPNTDLNAMSVIEYAVAHLKVDRIVVCGHYYCGGVKAAMESSDLGLLNPWLRNIRDVYRIHKNELNEIKDQDLKYKRLVELNVQEQCVNVIKTAVVQKAYLDRNIQVYGWVFDIHSGKLIDLGIDFPKLLADVMEIYRLS